MFKRALVALGLVGAMALMLVACSVTAYNGMGGLDQQVQSQWAQVENTYQRRATSSPVTARCDTTLSLMSTAAQPNGDWRAPLKSTAS